MWEKEHFCDYFFNATAKIYLLKRVIHDGMTFEEYCVTCLWRDIKYGNNSGNYSDVSEKKLNSGDT